MTNNEGCAPRKGMDIPIFVLKVALAAQKRIWRRIAMRGSQTLDDGGRYPRVLEKKGDSPPQYPDSQ